MRVMVLVKASEDSESGRMPTSEELAEMGKFNEQLLKAGVMLAADGLSASKDGKRVRFEQDRKPVVIDGPFTETKELVAGYWIWEVASLEEAVEWLKRSPFQDTEVEIRRVFEPEDFGDESAPEMQNRVQQLRDELSSRQG